MKSHVPSSHSWHEISVNCYPNWKHLPFHPSLRPLCCWGVVVDNGQRSSWPHELVWSTAQLTSAVCLFWAVLSLLMFCSVKASSAFLISVFHPFASSVVGERFLLSACSPVAGHLLTENTLSIPDVSSSPYLCAFSQPSTEAVHNCLTMSFDPYRLGIKQLCQRWDISESKSWNHSCL